VGHGERLRYKQNMGAIISYVGNTILRQKMKTKTKTSKKKSTTKKAPTDFFGEALKYFNQRTVLPETAGKGVVKGNTVARIHDFINQSGENKENE